MICVARIALVIVVSRTVCARHRLPVVAKAIVLFAGFAVEVICLATRVAMVVTVLDASSTRLRCAVIADAAVEATNLMRCDT